MPCRNDYDPPSQAQQANRVAARLLIVLNNKQNHLSSTQLLVDSTNTYLETDYVKVLCERLTEMFKKALHGISLASQNSSSKEECGRIASKALEEARQWRIKAVEEQSAWTQRMAAVEDASASDPTAPVIGTPLVNVPATQMVGGKAIDDAMEIAERLALRLVFRNNTRTDSGYESADIAANEVRKELRAALESLAAPRQAEAGPGRHWWPVSKGHADNVCAAAPQQAEPVAQIGWSDEFGNLFPMGAWKPAQRTHHDSHKAAWRPVFLHPPAAEVQRLRDALTAICAVADDREEGNYDTVPIHFIRSIARDATKGGK